MMGRKGSSSTIGAMHVGAGMMAFALGRAIQDGAQRAHDLRQVDRAHRIGMGIVIRARQQRRAADLEKAAAAKVRLMANRARLHG